jgi:O-antigen biosynthesis protein
VIGAESAPATPLAVWIDGAGDAAEQTRVALAAGTIAPAAVLDGPLIEALASTRADHVALVRAGDRPAPPALERLGQAIALAPDADVITCDNDQLSAAGTRGSPCFSPGPSPDRWLACDDSGALIVVSREGAAALTQTLPGGGAWRHELALRLAGPAAAAHAHVPLILCHEAPSPPTEPLSAAAVTEILSGWEPGARVEQTSPRVRRVGRPPAREPSVEVIICFRDRPELLARAADSLLRRTDYERLTLALVDNGSRTTETATLVQRLACDERVRVLRDDRPFNFGQLNNAAVRTSDADVVVFLNNDTEVLDPDWASPLLEEALRPEVGAVAPLLRYLDGSVQHAGAAIGLHGYAGHPFAGLAPDRPTPFGHAAQGTRNWLAVTAACMMIERAKFTAVGGFDDAFVVAGNDVDLCLRLTSAGRRSLCVPHATLMHDESQSRGDHIDPGDFVASERSYGAFRTVGDPFYNPNLTLRATDCAVRAPDEELP